MGDQRFRRWTTTGKVPVPGTVLNFRNAKIAKPEE